MAEVQAHEISFWRQRDAVCASERHKRVIDASEPQAATNTFVFNSHYPYNLADILSLAQPNHSQKMPQSHAKYDIRWVPIEANPQVNGFHASNHWH